MFSFNLVRDDGSIWATVTVRASGVTAAARCIPVSEGISLVLL